MFELIDFFLPCSVDQEYIDAQLNRNNDVSTYIWMKPTKADVFKAFIVY